MIPVLLFALTAHEFAHGYVAFRLGDPTAKAAGRLTMNPLKHLDPMGTIAIFLIKFGWARPVPVNPNYFRNPRQDMLVVALAGPMTNLIIAIASGLLFKVLIAIAPMLPSTETVVTTFSFMINCLAYSVILNLILCVFNFLPIPPLDGSRILMGVLPEKLAIQYSQYEKYGFILLLILVFTGSFGKIISPINQFVLSWLST